MFTLCVEPFRLFTISRTFVVGFLSVKSAVVFCFFLKILFYFLLEYRSNNLCPRREAHFCHGSTWNTRIRVFCLEVGLTRFLETASRLHLCNILNMKSCCSFQTVGYSMFNLFQCCKSNEMYLCTCVTSVDVAQWTYCKYARLDPKVCFKTTHFTAVSTNNRMDFEVAPVSKCNKRIQMPYLCISLIHLSINALFQMLVK